jgi:hypothetical protein
VCGILLTASQPAEFAYRSVSSPGERLRALVQHAILAPSGHNTQLWRFRVDGDALDVYAGRRRSLPAVDAHGREPVISCGAAVVNAWLALRRFGFPGPVELLPSPDDAGPLMRPPRRAAHARRGPAAPDDGAATHSPRNAGGTMRKFATHRARRALEAIGAATQIGVHLALGPALRPWRRRWGATDREVQRPLLGDDLVPQPTWVYTHAITIRAPRSKVWPWLLQLGQGRGGFYSYEGLENLVGCGIHNVLELRPELQRLRVGDTVRTHRSGYGPTVTRLEPERALVLGGPPNAKGSRAVWAFHLVDGPDGTTRLLERGRSSPGRGLLERLTFGPYLVEPIGFVMSKKLLRTIRDLAEHRASGDGRRVRHLATRERRSARWRATTAATPSTSRSVT